MPLRIEIKRKLAQRSERVKSVDLHPTEPWVLVSLYSGSVGIWDYQSQIFDQDLRRCLASTEDGTVLIWHLTTYRSLTIGGIAGLCLRRKKGSDLLAGCRRIQEGEISCAAVVCWMLTHTRRARGRGVLRLLLAGSGCIQGGDANAEEVDNAGGGKKNKEDGFL